MVERSELYILAGEDGVKKMMNINANKNIEMAGMKTSLAEKRLQSLKNRFGENLHYRSRSWD